MITVSIYYCFILNSLLCTLAVRSLYRLNIKSLTANQKYDSQQ
jgi:hypothetical protein